MPLPSDHQVGWRDEAFWNQKKQREARWRKEVRVITTWKFSSVSSNFFSFQPDVQRATESDESWSPILFEGRRRRSRWNVGHGQSLRISKQTAGKIISIEPYWTNWISNQKIELRTGPLWPANPQEAQQQKQRRLFCPRWYCLSLPMLPGAFARSVCVGHSTTVEFQLIFYFLSWEFCEASWSYEVFLLPFSVYNSVPMNTLPYIVVHFQDFPTTSKRLGGNALENECVRFEFYVRKRLRDSATRVVKRSLALDLRSSERGRLGQPTSTTKCCASMSSVCSIILFLHIHIYMNTFKLCIYIYVPGSGSFPHLPWSWS